MRIGSKEEHKKVISIIDSLLVNKKQVISRKKIKNNLSSEDFMKIENHLGDYLDEKNPIYLYIKNEEIYFQLRYHNQIITGFDEYEEAKTVYRKIRKGDLSIKDIKDLKSKKKNNSISTPITLEDGFKRMLEKHMNEYNAGNVKFSSYTKKESTIKYHILPHFDKKPLNKITEGDIERFVDQIKYKELSGKHKIGEDKKLSISMQNEVFMYFKKLFKTTKRYYNVEVNLDIDEIMEEIVGKSILNRDRKKYNIKVGEIIENIYNDLEKIFPGIYILQNGIYNPIFGIELMIYYTGMRIGEVIAINPKDYDPVNKSLFIHKSISWHPNKNKTRKPYVVTSTKSWDERTILLPDSICKYLEGYIRKLKKMSFYCDEMFIFSRLDYARSEQERMYPFSLKTFNNQIKKAYDYVGLLKEHGAVPRNHTARHAFNTLLKNNHVEEYDRKTYLGHSNGTGVNEGYTHKSREEEMRIIEISERFCRKIVDKYM